MNSAGQAYITGDTQSADFPASLGPGYDTSHNGYDDAFVVKLNTAGTALLYATFLDGSNNANGNDIAVDGAGQAYITGYTDSPDFPASLGPGYDTSFNGGEYEAFIVKLNPAGTGLLDATFLGGSSSDYGRGIAWTAPARPTSRAVRTRRTSRPTVAPATHQLQRQWRTPSSSSWPAARTALRYATFLGGSGDDDGYSIALDDAGLAYVTGLTGSADFPACRGPGYDTSYNNVGYAFSISWTRPAPACVTPPFLAAAPVTPATTSPWTAPARPFITGHTGRQTFPPALARATTPAYNGGGDTFVIELDAAGTALRYATFLGGSDSEDGYSIAVDSIGQAMSRAIPVSANFPAGPGYDTILQQLLSMPSSSSWMWPVLLRRHLQLPRQQHGRPRRPPPLRLHRPTRPPPPPRRRGPGKPGCRVTGRCSSPAGGPPSSTTATRRRRCPS